MSESEKHRKLVEALYDYVCSLVEDGTRCLVTFDGYGALEHPRRNPDGFRPDVEYYYDGIYIVGDAKTSKDIDTFHSREQYKSYLRECERATFSLFVIAVPFCDSECAKALIHNIQYSCGSSIRYVVINERGVYFDSSK